jgi:hypothetical protein
MADTDFEDIMGGNKYDFDGELSDAIGADLSGKEEGFGGPSAVEQEDFEDDVEEESDDEDEEEESDSESKNSIRRIAHNIRAFMTYTSFISLSQSSQAGLIILKTI